MMGTKKQSYKQKLQWKLNRMINDVIDQITQKDVSMQSEVAKLYTELLILYNVRDNLFPSK